MGLEEELTLALKNRGYADALLALLKNIVIDRNALYAVGEWVALYDAGLVAEGKIGDDKLGRALDRLFAADRATLQTRVVLALMCGFDLAMDRIHNDTTSVMVRGAYDHQHPRAIQLKRGHSKERRPRWSGSQGQELPQRLARVFPPGVDPILWRPRSA